MMTEATTATPSPPAPASQPSLFRPPQISWRWLPVFRRNLLVWRKLAVPSLVGNIAEPLITLVAFGYGIGALIGQVQLGGNAVPYILFLASGSICMSAMNAASFEALYSAFSRMNVQRTWDGIMNAPVRLDDVVFAEMLWAAFKSLFTSAVILAVMLALGISHSPMLLLALPLLGLVGIVFSSIALIFNALAKGYDFFHLLLLALPHADDVPERRVFSARPVAGRDAGDVRLAAADRRRRADTAAVPGPVAGASAAAPGGAGGLCGGGFLGRAGTDTQAFSELKKAFVHCARALTAIYLIAKQAFSTSPVEVGLS